MFVSGTDGFDQFLFLFFVDFFPFALKLLQFYFGERASRGVAAHDCESCSGPGEHKSRVVGLAAHGIISGAEAATANHRDFWNDAVCHGVYHFRAGANDAAPLRVFSDHETVYVMQKNQRNAVLVAIENEAGGFFRGLGIDYAAKFDAFLVRAARQRLHVFFLIGYDADGPAADARVTTEQSFSILCAIFFEFTGVHNAGDDLPHVVLFSGIARKQPVDIPGGKERVARFHMAEWRSVGRAHLVYQRANPRDARIVVRLAEIHRAANLGVHFGAAEVFRGSFLSNGCLHQSGPWQKSS